jgi:hypothetical protein
MKNTTMTKAFASTVLVVFSAMLGCGQGEARPATGAGMADAARGSSHSFAFGAAGAQASSRVERQLAADGGEVMHGTTEVLLEGAAHPVVVSETAEIDASGRLVRATSELYAGANAMTLVRAVQIDAAKGAVTVRDEGGERFFRAPAGQPWVYTGLFSDVAPQASGITAVEAWVARRAAQTGGRIRMVEVLAHRSSLTLPDQIVFHNGATDLVVLGDEVAETDREFVRALPWKALESLSNELRAADGSCGLGPV